MLLVLPEGVGEASLLATLTPSGRPVVTWMVISLVSMLRPVMASEKLSQLVGSSGVSKSRSFQGTFVSLTPAPTQQLLGRQGPGARGSLFIETSFRWRDYMKEEEREKEKQD